MVGCRIWHAYLNVFLQKSAKCNLKIRKKIIMKNAANDDWWQSNQKRFLEYIAANNVEKISKLINKGLDPNFHCNDSGGKWSFKSQVNRQEKWYIK